MRALLLCLSIVAATSLSGCASFPNSTIEQSTPAARALLEAAARAHGLAAYRSLIDINVSYDGEWFPAVARLQPILVDSGFRGTSQERIMVRTGLIGQSHRGPDGVKHVARGHDATAVWFNGRRDMDQDKRLAAGLVADGYRLFLLGPIYLLERERDAIVELIEPDVIDGIEYDRLFARLRPGLGHQGQDRVVMWIDKTTRLMRRLWISADALPSTRGVVAEIDVFDVRELAGMRLPTRFFERLKRPFPLDVHQWRLTGFDVDRGYAADEVMDGALRGAALPAARSLGAP